MNSGRFTVDFFMKYAESKGGLAEAIPEGALIVLPEEVSTLLDLPEQVGFTDDPEVSREDDFVLLSPGHPLLMAAAEEALKVGDVGCAHLYSPAILVPTPDKLQQLARNEIYADHGRIDIVGSPKINHFLVLRMGVLLTYSLSVDEQIHEVEEIWIRVDTGGPLADDLATRLLKATWDPSLPSESISYHGEGIERADALIKVRADNRSKELSRQRASRSRSQLQIVDDYYQRVLSSIEERKEKAKESSVALLASQAEATKAEWERRRDEVANELIPIVSTQPFRLHLLAMSTYKVDAVIRRGARVFPFVLNYLPFTSSFIPPSCPTCGSSSVLVAAKDHLGCRACIKPHDNSQGKSKETTDITLLVSPTIKSNKIKPANSAPGANSKEAVSSTKTSNKQIDDASAKDQGRLTKLLPETKSRKATINKKSTTGRVTQKGVKLGDSISKIGMTLATRLFENLAFGEHFRSRDILQSSPIESLFNLYGIFGPAFIIGLSDDEKAVSIRTRTHEMEESESLLTPGYVSTSKNRDLPFYLDWRKGHTVKLVGMGALQAADIALFQNRKGSFPLELRKRYETYLTAPQPLVDVNPIVEILLNRSSAYLGLAYAMKTIACWGYLENKLEIELRQNDVPQNHIFAAGIEIVMAKREGLFLTHKSICQRYECSTAEVRNIVRNLQSGVPDTFDLGW